MAGCPWGALSVANFYFESAKKPARMPTPHYSLLSLKTPVLLFINEGFQSNRNLVMQYLFQ